MSNGTIGRKGPATLAELIAATSGPQALAESHHFASFSGGVLSVFGDAQPGSLLVGRDASGRILLDGGLVPVTGGTPTVANTTLIQVFGQGGDDVVTLDQSNGALPRANLFGGSGDDTLTGGSGGDMLFGQADDDTLSGKGGVDFLFGGAGDDTLTGGDGDDQVFGEAGDDRMIWNPGDDSDLFEGGAGTDTAEVNGGGGNETFTATANGSRVRLDRLDPAPFALDIGTTERLVVNMNGGDDTFSATGNLATLIGVTVDGGTGNDTIRGGNGADVLLGGDGNDFVDGNQGNDVVLLGGGDDTAQWDPGDGSDVVEGGAGLDTLAFNGSAGNEVMALMANGGRMLLTRNLGNIVMDLADMERVNIQALGGADTINVGDLTGTDVSEVRIDLAGLPGGGAGDGAADTVVTNGIHAGEAIEVIGSGGAYTVVGLPATVGVTRSEGANDALVVNGLGGDDAISAATLGSGTVRLTLDGGAGHDTLVGSSSADVFLGGDGNDTVDGNAGNDVALLGAGDDHFLWNPGDGSDTVEGQGGTDTLQFFTSNVSENLQLVANGGRALLIRDVASVAMDLNDMETIEIRTLGGSDAITIGDLSGTDIRDVEVDLRGPSGGGDGAVDTVTVNAAQGSDVFGVTGDAGGVRVFGLPAVVDVFQADAADRLVLNGLGGDDVIDASSLEAGAVQLTINGGLGADVILGSEGGDLINGGDGNDVALMDAGDDTFVWNPGDDNDTLEGQAGFDTLVFEGSNAAETITLSASGGRALLARDVANVRMDLNDVEAVDLRTRGGADAIRVGDLSGTDMEVVTIDVGAADGLLDTITIDATNGDDVIVARQEGGVVSIRGLESEIRILGLEATDRLVINGLGGDDVIEASGLGPSVGLTALGGAGDDVLVGGGSADILRGEAGDDVLIGGAGLDVLDGGPGNDVEIQGPTALMAGALQAQAGFLL